MERQLTARSGHGKKHRVSDTGLAKDVPLYSDGRSKTILQNVGIAALLAPTKIPIIWGLTMLKKLILCTALSGLFGLSACFKATGGGWFIDADGDLVTFGFTAQPDGEPTANCDGSPFPFPEVPTCQPAKGRFTLIDHGTESGESRIIRGKITGTYNPADGNPDDGSQFAGTAIIDGEEWIMGFRVTDAGEPGLPDDFVFLMLDPAVTADGNPDLVYIGSIGNGNIQVHAR